MLPDIFNPKLGSHHVLTFRRSVQTPLKRSGMKEIQLYCLPSHGVWLHRNKTCKFLEKTYTILPDKKLSYFCGEVVQNLIYACAEQGCRNLRTVQEQSLWIAKFSKLAQACIDYLVNATVNKILKMGNRLNKSRYFSVQIYT